MCQWAALASARGRNIHRDHPQRPSIGIIPSDHPQESSNETIHRDLPQGPFKGTIQNVYPQEPSTGTMAWTILRDITGRRDNVQRASATTGAPDGQGHARATQAGVLRWWVQRVEVTSTHTIDQCYCAELLCAKLCILYILTRIQQLFLLPDGGHSNSHYMSLHSQ